MLALQIREHDIPLLPPLFLVKPTGHWHSSSLRAPSPAVMVPGGQGCPAKPHATTHELSKRKLYVLSAALLKAA